MATLKDIYDIIKELHGFAKEIQNGEVSALVSDIQDKYFELKEEMDELKQENKDLKKRIEKLTNNDLVGEDIEIHPNGYLIKISEKNQGSDVKYCSNCWYSNQMLIPLNLSPMQSRKIWQCFSCNGIVEE